MKRPCSKKKYYISVRGDGTNVYQWSMGPNGTPRWTTKAGTSYHAHSLDALLHFIESGEYIKQEGWS